MVGLANAGRTVAQPCAVQIECQQIVDGLVQQRSLEDQRVQTVQRECQATIDALVRLRSEEDERMRIISAELVAAQAKVSELESVRLPPQPQRRDASTQTRQAVSACVSSQTLEMEMVTAETQTPRKECGATAAHAETEEPESALGTVTTVGPRMHPAQVEAIQRAERAAARLEQLQADTERRAEAYRSPPSTPTRTGGRQIKKAQLRRQAAAAGVEVADWMAARGPRLQHGTWFEDARGVLEQRLDLAHEEWKRKQDAEGAEERFRLAARDTGISVE